MSYGAEFSGAPCSLPQALHAEEDNRPMRGPDSVRISRARRTGDEREVDV